MQTNNSILERNLLLKSARKAAQRAKRISAALELPIKLIANGVLIEKYPDGRTKKIRKIEQAKSQKKQLNKGSTLCLK